MKTTILTIAIIAIAAIGSFAQTKNNNSGNWVVESNIKQPKVQTIKFYTDDSQLLYSETVNMRLNISKKKVRQNLNQILTALIADKSIASNQAIIATAFNLKNTYAALNIKKAITLPASLLQKLSAISVFANDID